MAGEEGAASSARGCGVAGRRRAVRGCGARAAAAAPAPAGRVERGEKRRLSTGAAGSTFLPCKTNVVLKSAKIAMVRIYLVVINNSGQDWSLLSAIVILSECPATHSILTSFFGQILKIFISTKEGSPTTLKIISVRWVPLRTALSVARFYFRPVDRPLPAHVIRAHLPAVCRGSAGCCGWSRRRPPCYYCSSLQEQTARARDVEELECLLQYTNGELAIKTRNTLPELCSQQCLKASVWNSGFSNRPLHTPTPALAKKLPAAQVSEVVAIK